MQELEETHPFVHVAAKNLWASVADAHFVVCSNVLHCNQLPVPCASEHYRSMDLHLPAGAGVLSSAAPGIADAEPWMDKPSGVHLKSAFGSFAWFAASRKGTKAKQSSEALKARLRTQAKNLSSGGSSVPFVVAARDGNSPASRSLWASAFACMLLSCSSARTSSGRQNARDSSEEAGRMEST